MSKDWFADIAEMHKKYGVGEWMKNATQDQKKAFLKFRLNFLEEELTETERAIENNDHEEIVDGLIDLCVVAIGTLEAFNINAHDAWDEVLKANMNKEVGVKPERPNKLGLPDLIKPEGWEAPSHAFNYGVLPTGE